MPFVVVPHEWQMIIQSTLRIWIQQKNQEVQLRVEAGFDGDTRWRRFIPHHSLLTSNPYVLQYPRILDLVLIQNREMIKIAPSPWRCWSPKSKIDCSYSFESLFQGGITLGESKILGMGRPFGMSTRIRSTYGCILRLEPFVGQILIFDMLQTKSTLT